MNVANLHSDLLSYLAVDSSRTAYDLTARASIPQLLEGGVLLETLVTYVKTEEGCSDLGDKQWQIYTMLSQRYPEFCQKIQTVFAIENASGFCSEEESLASGMARL